MYVTETKILDLDTAIRRVHSWRLHSPGVVFTNGCFDLLHAGHVSYLQAAANLGHQLVVGLNTDASVQRLKGPTRPLNSLEDRARVLAALAFVDAVVPFDEDTPLNLILALRPDVLAKGADYEIDQIVGAKEVMGWGGRVERIALVEGRSTTGMINKMKA